MNPENKSRRAGEQKVVMMPKLEVMEQKLHEAKVLGIAPQTDKFYKHFAASVADSQKVGSGLSLAWDLASYDTLSDLPPAVQIVVDMNFDDVIDAVTPDKEVATQAKEFRKKTLEEMGKK